MGPLKSEVGKDFYPSTFFFSSIHLDHGKTSSFYQEQILPGASRRAAVINNWGCELKKVKSYLMEPFPYEYQVYPNKKATKLMAHISSHHPPPRQEALYLTGTS